MISLPLLTKSDEPIDGFAILAFLIFLHATASILIACSEKSFFVDVVRSNYY